MGESSDPAPHVAADVDPRGARAAMDFRPLLTRFAVAALITGAFAAASAQPLLAQSADRGKTSLPALKAWTGDFDSMQKRRQIRILVPYSKTIYFIDKGEQFGTAFEFGREFDKWLNKGKKKQTEHIVVAFIPTSRGKLLRALNEGHGDIVAGNLTITPERRNVVDFTAPVVANVREVLVTGPAAPAITAIEDLSGKDLYVRKSSSYYEHLVSLNAGFAKKKLKPVRLVPGDEQLEDEDLLEMVNAGLIPMIIMDSHKAHFWSQIFDNITVRDDIAVRNGAEIAWAFRKKSPKLKAIVNEFIKGHKKGTMIGNMLLKRYLKSTQYVKNALDDKEMQKFSAKVVVFKNTLLNTTSITS